MTIKIHKCLTSYNHTKGVTNKRKAIAIHYVGEVSGAKANCQYFQGGDRQAGCHYFVDDEIWQSQTDDKVAWHIGASAYTYKSNVAYAKAKGYKGAGARYHDLSNNNTIGIEMCLSGSKNGMLYTSKKTEENTAKLVQYLMKKYNINSKNVVRHFDVTGKMCPLCTTSFTGNLVKNWTYFKRYIIGWRIWKAKKDLIIYNKPNGDKVGDIKKGAEFTVIGLNATRRWFRVPEGWVKRGAARLIRKAK